MFLCRVCHSEVELDDVMFRLSSGLVVCEHCVDHQSGTARRVSETIQRDINHEEKDLTGQRLEPDQETAAMERPM